MCNHWFTLAVAVVILLFFWVFSPTRWANPYLVNAGLLLLTAALIRTGALVHRNLQDLAVR